MALSRCSMIMMYSSQAVFKKNKVPNRVNLGTIESLIKSDDNKIKDKTSMQLARNKNLLRMDQENITAVNEILKV